MIEDIKWLQAAISAEKTALHNYLDYAQLTNDRTGKDMFIKLALDEFRHMDALEKELAHLHRGKSWQRITIPSSSMKLTVSLPKKNNPVDQTVAGHSETEALTVALRAEDKAMKFYLAKASQVKDRWAKALLARLAEMEKAHYQIIQAELDSINRTGSWMGIREISFEMS